MTVLLDVDQLRAFIAIAETGSFTKAAEVVNKTQSAVSMQMKRLEERLDRPIFARDGRASKLTEDGQRLLDYARRNRRQASQLAALDRHMLADIGITRADVQDAFSEPFWEDPTALLHERAIERRLNRAVTRAFGQPAK